MAGVDHVDQQLQSYKVLRKTYNWYHKLALRLISQSVLNSHNVFLNFFQRNDMAFLQFMHDTIQLLLLYSPKMQTTILPPDDTFYRLTGMHFPATKQRSQDAEDTRPTKNCKVCYACGIRINKGKPVKTVHICKTCPSKPGLHIEKCFELYHTELNYAE